MILNTLKLFNNNYNVASNNHLEEYLNICSYPDINSKYAENHHILPKSLFPDYEINPENIVRLSYENHYLAHSLLALALDNDKMTQAWVLMNGYRYNGSSKIDLLGKDKYKELKKKSYDYLSSTVVVKENDTYKRIYKSDFNPDIHTFHTTNHTPVFDTKLNKNILIDVDEYHKNKNRYVSTIGHKIPVYCLLQKKNISVTKDEYENNPNYIALSTDRVGVTNSNGNKCIVTSETYQQNKDKYTHKNTDKVTVLLNDNLVTISVNEYRKNKDKYTHKNSGKISVIDRKTNKQMYINSADYDRKLYRTSTEGMTTALNSEGKSVYISSNKLKSEEYNHVNKSKLTVKNVLTNMAASMQIKSEEFVDKKYIISTTKYCYLIDDEVYRPSDIKDMENKKDIPVKYKQYRISINEYAGILKMINKITKGNK